MGSPESGPVGAGLAPVSTGLSLNSGSAAVGLDPGPLKSRVVGTGLKLRTSLESESKLVSLTEP
jgi:hypothetical protein